jgi:hypothetical protein
VLRAGTLRSDGVETLDLRSEASGFLPLVVSPSNHSGRLLDRLSVDERRLIDTDSHGEPQYFTSCRRVRIWQTRILL